MRRIDAGEKKLMVSAVSHGNTAKKDILESEHVCDRHFVSGKAAATWDKHNIDWIPTLQPGKTEYKGNEQKEKEQKASEERAERATNDKNSKLPSRGNI